MYIYIYIYIQLIYICIYIYIYIYMYIFIYNNVIARNVGVVKVKCLFEERAPKRSETAKIPVGENPQFLKPRSPEPIVLGI